MNINRETVRLILTENLNMKICAEMVQEDLCRKQELERGNVL
jgi:hypothetical protein